MKEENYVLHLVCEIEIYINISWSLLISVFFFFLIGNKSFIDRKSTMCLRL